MMYGSKVVGKTYSIPGGLVVGGVVSLLTTFVMGVTLAALMDNEILTWELAGYGIVAMVMLSSFFGAVISYRLIRCQKTIVSLMTGMVYFGMLLCITGLLFGGRYEAVFETACLVLGGSLCAAMIRGRESRILVRK